MFEGNSGTAYNLTGNELVSLEKIVKLASKILGKNLTIEETSETPSIRNPSSEIFKKIFGWEPEVSSLAGALQLFELYSGKRVQP
jgi:nucleoside-diphosphate-sugar epimerase